MHSYRLSGFIAGACYLIFWYSYLIFLPVAQITSNYAAVVNSRAWPFVNMFQIIAIIAFVQFYFSIKNSIYAKSHFVTIINIMQLIGFFCLMGIAFSENFVWPIVAKALPNMLNVNTGEIFTNKALMIFDIVSVLLFMASNIYFGLKLRKYFPVMGIVFLVGMTTFCLGFASGSIRYAVQTIGLTVYSFAFIAIGIKKGSMQ